MIFVNCDCHTEGLCVEADLDYNEFSFAYYQFSFDNRKLGFKQRLQHIWRVLWTGFPYTDMVMLPPDKAMLISDYIREKTIEMGKLQIPKLTIRKLEDEISPAFTITSNADSKSDVEACFKAALSAMEFKI